MAMGINTNQMSLNAQRQSSTAQAALGTAMARLSSGMRINTAKDDAAGLAIGERMNSQVRGMTVAIRNANDGISMAQTAESAMQAITDNLQARYEAFAKAEAGWELTERLNELPVSQRDEPAAPAIALPDDPAPEEPVAEIRPHLVGRRGLLIGLATAAAAIGVNSATASSNAIRWCRRLAFSRSAA